MFLSPPPPSTLSTYNERVGHTDQRIEVDVQREEPEDATCRMDNQILTAALQTEREERDRLRSEAEKLIREKETLEGQHHGIISHHP